MRVTVLCILALVGTTCALQLPVRASRQSILGIPIPKLGGDDSSSSSSSSEEDPSTVDLANSLAQRLVDDVVNGIEGLGAGALIPFNIVTTLTDTLTKDAKDWLVNVIGNNNLPVDVDVVKLSGDLVQSIIKDVQVIVPDILSNLLKPVELKAKIVKVLIRSIVQFLKKILPNGGHRPGQSPPPSHRPPHDKPPHHKPPHHNPPHENKPGHSQKPKQDSSSESSSSEKSSNRRSQRDIEITVSGDIDVDKLKNALSKVDFSKVTKEIPKIADLKKLEELSPLPGLAEATKHARKLLIKSLGVAAKTVPEAIQKALNLAIKSADPANAIVAVVNTILKTYLGVAQSVISLAPVGLALMREAAIIIGSVVSTVLSVLSASVAAGVQALL